MWYPIVFPVGRYGLYGIPPIEVTLPISNHLFVKSSQVFNLVG